MQKEPKQPLIGIVGVCASGKTTLIASLKHLGYNCRHIAQEHSYVQDMWKRLTNPDLLIYLEASYPATIERRKLNWSESEYSEQIRRLEHARVNADIVINTNSLTSEEVLEAALTQIAAHMG
jgi:deoxyadenosine/deoxycytidine kinase